MSPPPDWYLDQATAYYARADECRRLARELDRSPLPDLLSKAGADTWQSPAAAEFREQILVSQGQILDAITNLETNAYGFTADGDDMAREAERQRQAAPAQVAARRERDGEALGVD